MRKYTDTIVRWFESGDLIPLMVLVSAVHYAAVLRGKDGFAAAIAIGLLVDLGHYRTVRYAVRYTGVRKWEICVRWFVALIMTVVSFDYHYRYYQDVLLAAPLPFLIAVLAWLGSRSHNAPTKTNETTTTANDTQREHSETVIVRCDHCTWSRLYPNKKAATNGKNSHMKAHARNNGHSRRPIPEVEERGG